MAETEPAEQGENKKAGTVDLSALEDLDLAPAWSRPEGEIPLPKSRPKEDRPARRPVRRPAERRDRRPRRATKPDAPPAGHVPFTPTVNAVFYPEEAPFRALCKALRASCRTFELFEIARLILEKKERFIAVLHPLPGKGAESPTLYQSQLDGLPFETEELAAGHVCKHYLGEFFDIETVEVEPPKGSFPAVNRCGITGELLGPPNYHRYQQLLQQHHAARLSHMSFEKFLERVETVKDPETVGEWMRKMTREKRYVCKEPAEDGPVVLDNSESARFHLLTNYKDRLVKAVHMARFHGKELDKLSPDNSIRRSVETILENQKRFPLETANHLRGRLRRMNFAVYKKGSKGISYVSGVKRRFREPGQVFADRLQKLIAFIEQRSDLNAAALPREYLGLEMPEDAESQNRMAPEELSKLNSLRQDLRWLVTEGYVVEYSNGLLYAPASLPPRNPSKKESNAKQKKQAVPAPPSSQAEPGDEESAAQEPGAPEETGVPNEPPDDNPPEDDKPAE